MFDLFAPSHLLLIGIAVLVFIGPKDLPRFMHAVGRWTRKARGLMDEFHQGLDNMERQGELDALRKEIEALRNSDRDAVVAKAADAPNSPAMAASVVGVDSSEAAVAL